MTKRITRLICVLLSAVLLTAVLPGAFAASKKKEQEPKGKPYSKMNGVIKYAYCYSLTVYKEPKTTSDVKEVVPFAKEIMVLAEKKGWAKVYTTNHDTGYCKSDLLTNQNPNTYKATMYCQQVDAPYYLWPSVDAPLMGHLRQGEKVTMTAMTPLGDWLRIKHEKKYYYVQKPRMDYNKYAKGQDAWCIDDSVVVYYDPDLDTTLSTLYFGEHMTLVSKNGSWAKVRSDDDFIGYCDIGALSTVNPNSLNYTVYTQVSGNYMFTSSTDLSGRRQIDKNEAMTLLAVDANGFWARVQYEGKYYYLPYVFLGTEKRLGDYKEVTARAGLNIREGTKKSSTIVVTVPKGTKMWLIGATDNRAKVTTMPDYDGNVYTGFAELQYLK